MNLPFAEQAKNVWSFRSALTLRGVHRSSLRVDERLQSGRAIDFLQGVDERKTAFFRRCLLFAFGGAVSLALTACGGGSDSSGTVAAEPLQRAQALGEPSTAAAAPTLLSGDVAEGDGGAVSQEPKKLELATAFNVPPLC